MKQVKCYSKFWAGIDRHSATRQRHSWGSHWIQISCKICLIWWYCCFRECWYIAYQLVRVYVQGHQEQSFDLAAVFLGESFQQWWFFIWEGKRDFFLVMSSAMLCTATCFKLKINYNKLTKPSKHLKCSLAWGCLSVSEWVGNIFASENISL